jgi:very-short-patch-repair endonuclease
MALLKKFQKQLRVSQTEVEDILWYWLRNRRLQGFKFRRQHILQGYIVDFVCLERKVVIELDGGQHADQEIYDAARSEKLKKEGFQVLRFWNNEVTQNQEGVLETILQTLINSKTPLTRLAQKTRARRPLPQGERRKANFYSLL